MIVIHGSYRSRATRNIWLLEEMGVPWRLEPVLQHYRQGATNTQQDVAHTRSPTFLARFPFGTIPVMEDGDVCLGESLAINLYLARKYGGDMRPYSIEQEAMWTQWALFGATAIEPAALALAEAAKAGGMAAAEAVHLECALDRPFSTLERSLAGKRWLAGSTFSVADINMAEIVRFASSRTAMFERFPAIKSWLARCHARPAFRRMWALRNAEPV